MVLQSTRRIEDTNCKRTCGRGSILSLVLILKQTDRRLALEIASIKHVRREDGSIKLIRQKCPSLLRSSSRPEVRPKSAPKDILRADCGPEMVGGLLDSNGCGVMVGGDGIDLIIHRRPEKYRFSSSREGS
jgi:hypothetical protein